MPRVMQLFICFLLYTSLVHARDAVDCIVFSYDRPMQLYAFLESLDALSKGVDTVVVVYKVSNQDYQVGYARVEGRFENVVFLNENNFNNNFKATTLHAFSLCTSNYIFFAVDDIIVTDHIDFYDCTRALKEYSAYGFYLRMGKNVIYNYPHNCRQPLPAFLSEINGVCAWRFSQGAYSWRYPNTVDMTVYKTQEIYPLFVSMHYANPNLLEDVWARRWKTISHRIGLCYEVSKMINIPVNRVQNVRDNRYMDAYTTEDLLEIFNDGKKIDVQSVYQVENQWTHTELPLSFVER